MAVYLIFSLLMALIPAASPLNEQLQPPSLSKEMLVAVQEMQRARYFTFVMLVKMAQDKLPSNSTFFMPSDQVLSTVYIPGSEVLEFLNRHSVPAPLLFENLIRLPSGTLIPSYKSNCMIRVYSDHGGSRLYLNDVQLVRPNVCIAGSSFRCHGINGVLQAGKCNSSSLPPAPLPTPPSLTPPPPPPPTVSQPPEQPRQGSARSTSSTFNGIVLLLLLMTNLLGLSK